MAVKRDSRYPGRWTPADADFPLGGPKNRTTSTSQDGSYFNRDFIADYEAFFQRLMVEGGVTANEAPDTAPTSQFFEALVSSISKSSVGLIAAFHTPVAIQGWIDLKGGELSRITDKLLWDYAVAAGMTVAQATKDADPMTHAMKFGDGDGATTFTLPNHHLGHFVRGNPSGVNHGETQGDAIRNITGSVYAESIDNDPGKGALYINHHGSNRGSASDTGNAGVLVFDASRIVPTANENRPYTANLSIKIHRGWM